MLSCPLSLRVYAYEKQCNLVTWLSQRINRSYILTTFHALGDLDLNIFSG